MGTREYWVNTVSRENVPIPAALVTLRFPSFLQPAEVKCASFEAENDLWPMAALVNFQEHALPPLLARRS